MNGRYLLDDASGVYSRHVHLLAPEILGDCSSPPASRARCESAGYKPLAKKRRGLNAEMAEKKGQLFPIAVIARVLELTERRVYQLAKEGIIPRATAGKYDLIDCVQGYIRYLRAAAGGGRLISDDIAQDKARLMRAQAEAVEMDNAERRGELMKRSLALRAWGRAVSVSRGKFLAYFDKVPPRVVGCSKIAEIRDIMRRARLRGP